MKLLDRYIGTTVLASVGGVILLIVALDGLFAFIAELGRLTRGYQLVDALTFIVLTLPGRFCEYIPVGTLVGCLVGLGTLAGTSELTVMRAAGVSVARIVMSAVKPVLVIVATGLILAQFVVPPVEQYADSQRSRLMDGQDVFTDMRGSWYRDGGEFLRVNAIQPGGVLFGVARYRFDDQRLVEAIYADRAIFQGDHWMMEGVRQTLFEPDRTRQNLVATLRWDTGLSPRMVSIVTMPPANLSITDLISYARYRSEQNLEAGPYYFQFWRKVLQPLSTVVMVFIAVSFIFGPLRSVTMGQRLITGVIVGLVFNYGQQSLGHISVVFDVPPFIAAMFPIVAFSALGARMIRRL